MKLNTYISFRKEKTSSKHIQNQNTTLASEKRKTSSKHLYKIRIRVQQPPLCKAQQIFIHISNDTKRVIGLFHPTGLYLVCKIRVGLVRWYTGLLFHIKKIKKINKKF